MVQSAARPALRAGLTARAPSHWSRPGSKQLVAIRAPMRNIVPCGACHGGLDDKAGSPWLEGQPVARLQTQLLAFAAGTRCNDISGQMRNIARRMMPAKIEIAAGDYASQP